MPRTIFQAAEDNACPELGRILQGIKQRGEKAKAAGEPTRGAPEVDEQYVDSRSCGPTPVKVALTAKKGIGWAGIALGALGVVCVIGTGGVALIPGLIGAGVWTGGSSIVAFAGNDTLAPLAHNQTGWTALHFAASTGSFKAAKELIWAGASTTIRSDEGHTFLALAESLHEYDIRGGYRNFADKCRAEIARFATHKEEINRAQAAENAIRAKQIADQAEYARQLNQLMQIIQERDAGITERDSRIAALEAVQLRGEKLTVRLHEELLQLRLEQTADKSEITVLRSKVDGFCQIVRQRQAEAARTTSVPMVETTAAQFVTVDSFRRPAANAGISGHAPKEATL